MSSIDCQLLNRENSTAISLDDVSEHINDPANFIWIELQSPDTATIHKLGEEFGLHELALEDCNCDPATPQTRRIWRTCIHLLAHTTDVARAY